MLYNGYLIEQDNTGYAPNHNKFSFSDDEGDVIGYGESIEDCQIQIDELNEMIYHQEIDNT